MFVEEVYVKYCTLKNQSHVDKNKNVVINVKNEMNLIEIKF